MSRPDPMQALAAARHEFGEHGGVNMSVEGSTTFTVMRAKTLPELFEGRMGPREGCYLYGRHFNPTVYGLSAQLAALEGTEAAYCTASGMSAIAATVVQLCRQGDHVVASRAVYGGTYALFHSFLSAKMGLEVTFVDASDLEAVEAAMTERTRVLFVETFSNPTLAVADIPRLADIAHRNGARLVVDNTFSPVVVSPARLGADVVVHSLTKFVSGASDVIAGAICGTYDFVGSMMDVNTGALMLLGPTMDPFVAEKLSLRLPHLGLRMAEHGRRALALCERLEALGYHAIYPGLPGHPDHQLLARIANPGYGHGGVFGIDLETRARAERFLELLQNTVHFGFIAVSLGYFDSLLTVPSESVSSELESGEQAKAGITEGLVRIALGYTGTLEQRWEQLAEALRQLEAETRTRSA